ncbi:MAG: transposase, partial [Nitrosopumilaceae archaeon]|nr:transposase [Nitrosopumilaceae archaeon]
MPKDMLGLVLFTAGKAAYGSFSVDSTHHRFNRYALVDDPRKEKRANAKKGRRAEKDDAPKEKKWVADTCKHHALISPDGLILAWMVTDGNTADSPMFEKLCAKIPEGSGP